MTASGNSPKVTEVLQALQVKPPSLAGQLPLNFAAQAIPRPVPADQAKNK
jgi:hypothetical protein